MATTPELDLGVLATANANAFLDAILDAAEAGLAHSDTDELTEGGALENLQHDGFTFTLVDEEGGGEGGGEYVHRIFEVKQHGTSVSYLKATGNYQSYNGTEFDSDWEVVYPHQVVVTQYLDHPAK